MKQLKNVLLFRPTSKASEFDMHEVEISQLIFNSGEKNIHY